MDDPRNLPIPGDPLGRIEAFVRGMAYGCLAGDWTSTIYAGYERESEHWENLGSREQKQAFLTYLDRWKGLLEVSPSNIASLGYFSSHGKDERGFRRFTLSQSAFELLFEPAKPATAFVSYSRSESSAFGLLIVAKLQSVGIDNPFIDMDIDPGDDWEERIRKEIEGCEYVIVIIGQETLASPYVQQEIEWAFEYGKTIIPVWHNGFVRQDDYPENLGRKNAIIVSVETAKDYNQAVVDILNRLGYAPR